MLGERRTSHLEDGLFGERVCAVGRRGRVGLEWFIYPHTQGDRLDT
jgi:hypothetical protein